MAVVFFKESMSFERRLGQWNKRIANELGRSPFDFGEQPLFKWIWSPELLFPVLKRMGGGVKQIESGLYAGLFIPFEEPEYEMIRQIDDDQWVLAKWEHPGSPEAWSMKYGKETPFPCHGYYTATNIMLKQGVEPNEEATQEMICEISARRKRGESIYSFRQILGELEEREGRKQRKREDLISDCVDEYTFESIPGKRGGTKSIGGFEEPALA